MDRNSRLEPSMLSAQSNSAISILQTNNADLGILQAAVSQFVGNSEIKSSSFDNMKQQMNDYNTCIDGMRSANDADIADHQSLISALGSANGSMNGNDIFDEKEAAEQGRAEAEQATDNARWCAGLFTFLNNADVRYYFERLADTDDEEARNWNEIILGCQEQIDIYDEIETATAGLFVSGTAMRNIACSALEEVKGAFRNGVYTPNMNAAWRKQLQSQTEIAATEYLLKQGLTRQEIMNMLGLGYTAADVKEQWDLCETDIEKQFFRNLMVGTEQSYIEAFETDPYKLSDDLTFIMSEYSYRLLVHNQLDKLNELNNAVLSSERYRTTEKQGEYCDRDVYLEKLGLGTSILLEGDAALLAAMNPDDPGYAKLYENYEKRAAMTNLWTTQSIMVDYLETHYINGEEAHQLSVSNIIYEGGGEMTFDFKRYSPFYGEYVTNQVDEDFLGRGSLVDNRIRLQKLIELQEAKERLFGNYVAKFIEGASILVAGAIAPELAILVSAGVMLWNNATGDGGVKPISKLDSLVKGEAAKLVMNLNQEALVTAINFLMAYQNTSQALDAANEEERISWFGLAGAYTIQGGKFNPSVEGNIEGMAYTGVYSPDTIRLMMQWEEKGLGSIPIWEGGDESLDQTEVEKLIKDVADKLESDSDYKKLGKEEREKKIEEEREKCRQLLEGGYDISGITDYAEFNKSIELIEEAYKNKLDIKGDLNSKMKASVGGGR